MLLKPPAKFCPLAERLGTSQGRNITQIKEVTPFPDYFFSCDYEQTSLFCSILADLVIKFMLTLEQKALKKLPQKRYLMQF